MIADNSNLSLIKISPGCIFAGYDILGKKTISEYILDNFNRPLSDGNRSVFLLEKKIFEKFHKEFAPLLKIFNPRILFFNGECSLEEIKRLYKEVSGQIGEKISILFAAGGGKLLDTSKLLASRIGNSVSLITIPTSCATCAAFTPIAPTYYPDGRKRKTIELPRPPEVMIIDHRILLNQPPRLLIAGIADAIAKYYETKAYIDSLYNRKPDGVLFFNDKIKIDLSIKTSSAISKEILEGAFEHSGYALEALKKGKITQHFCQIVYITLVMPGVVSGIGGKKCRTVAAHALANGLTYIPQARGSLHGEKVGWGTLVQLALEEKFSDLEELRSFLISIKAPVTLKSLLGGAKYNYQSVKKAFEVACSPEESMRFMPQKITPLMAYNAAISVENIG